MLGEAMNNRERLAYIKFGKLVQGKVSGYKSSLAQAATLTEQAMRGASPLKAIKLKGNFRTFRANIRAAITKELTTTAQSPQFKALVRRGLALRKQKWSIADQKLALNSHIRVNGIKGNDLAKIHGVKSVREINTPETLELEFKAVITSPYYKTLMNINLKDGNSI